MDTSHPIYFQFSTIHCVYNLFKSCKRKEQVFYFYKVCCFLQCVIFYILHIQLQMFCFYHRPIKLRKQNVKGLNEKFRRNTRVHGVYTAYILFIYLCNAITPALECFQYYCLSSCCISMHLGFSIMAFVYDSSVLYILQYGACCKQGTGFSVPYHVH